MTNRLKSTSRLRTVYIYDRSLFEQSNPMVSDYVYDRARKSRRYLLTLGLKRPIVVYRKDDGSVPYSAVRIMNVEPNR